MRRRFKAALALAVTLPVALAGVALAKRVVHFDDGDFVAPQSFGLTGRPIGGAQKAEATPAFLAGNRIASIGEDALVIDEDSGKLMRADATGKSLAALDIGKSAGLLAFDPIASRAYVADRMGDKIAVIKVEATKLTLERTIKTVVEPYGVALTPDRKTLLVTHIADRTLVAFSAETGKELWRTQLAREPRGIAVSSDGARAVVAYLVTGTVDQIDLKTHVASRVALSTTTPTTPRRGRRQMPSASGGGDAFARGSFAALFMGSSQAVVPFQRETPVQATGGAERAGSYGGGFEPPVTHQVAFLGLDGVTPRQATTAIAQHQPRALAWDDTRDALYIAGLGNDSVIQIKNASQATIAENLSVSLRNGNKCGPDGLAVSGSGDLLVWCAFTRSIERVDVVDGDGKLALPNQAKITLGPELTKSRMTEQQHTGYIAFHSAEAAVSQRGAMACSTCHPDNRADGLSWRIDKHELQTPVLAGRMVDTHPYKWDGGDKDLKTSLAMTMKRLGGFGLEAKQAEALQAYVEAMPNVRAPSRPGVMVARGKTLFDSAQLGCRVCHDGKTYSDNTKHKLSGTLEESDTPSLLGLHASAPYYHDGSAPTLESLLRDRAGVHGMADMSKLTDAQVADLVAFLETL
jgi:DNA-binding beta-propeller fold protein YncE